MRNVTNRRLRLWAATAIAGMQLAVAAEAQNLSNSQNGAPPAEQVYTSSGEQPRYVAQQPYRPAIQSQSQASATQQYQPAPTYVAARPPATAGQAEAITPTPQVSGYPSTSAAPYVAPRVYLAQNSSDSSVGSPSLVSPTEEIAPGAAQEYLAPESYGGHQDITPLADPAVDGGVVNEMYPDPGSLGDPEETAEGVEGNCDPAASEGGYPNYSMGYSTHGGDQPGRLSRLMGEHSCSYWFGGVYGLVMERDSSNDYPLTFAAAGLADGDFPGSSNVVMTTEDVDSGYQGGVEVRFGRTFGGAFDPWSGMYTPQWGLEGVYWEIFGNAEYDQYVDSGATRTFSMLSMAGLQFDPGGGAVAVNELWDYGTPVATGDFAVGMTRARTNFEARNFEVNLLRLSICGTGCGGPAMYSVGGGAADCESSSVCPDGGRYASHFSCTGVCGFRYLEFDEEFLYGVDYVNTLTAATGSLDYHADVENKLAGFQLGCNGIYRIGYKWGVHFDTLVGVYGNDIDARQYFTSLSGGAVTYGQSGETFDVAASKTDVAMLGELRLGMSYQATARMRLYGGWRALGISGLALANDQAPSAFLDAGQTANHVNSNGSMILHGLQTGVEWNY